MNNGDMALSGALAVVAVVASVLADPEVTPAPETRRSAQEPNLAAEIPGPAQYGVAEVATMTTTTNTTAKAGITGGGAGNLYPFTTQAQIKAQLGADRIFRVQTILTLFRLQTELEQATEETRSKNKQGFMSSDATRGSRLAKRIQDGLQGAPATMANLGFMSPEDWGLVDTIAPKYSRQMAKVARAREIAENPALKAVARMFSADTTEG